MPFGQIGARSCHNGDENEREQRGLGAGEPSPVLG